MSPFSLPVLGAALLVSSPALWNALVGDASLAVGLSRYLVAVVLCWMGLSVVAGLIGPPQLDPTPDEPPEGAPVDSPEDAAWAGRDR